MDTLFRIILRTISTFVFMKIAVSIRVTIRCIYGGTFPVSSEDQYQA
jgi:hypothetical protein